MKTQILFIILSLTVTLVSVNQAFSQNHPDFSARFSYGADLHLADLKAKYGNGLSAGIGGQWLKRNGVAYTAEWNLLFGSKVNDKSINSFAQPNGSFVGTDGQESLVYARYRGESVGFLISKILSKQAMQGFMVGFGSGIITHRTKYVDDTRSFNQIYYNGGKIYDRKTRGIYLREVIGYELHSKDGLINGIIQLEATQGLTKFVRKNQYAAPINIDGLLNDFSIGLKAVWFLPIIKSQVKDEIKYF
jgi:hypothetical protein